MESHMDDIYLRANLQLKEQEVPPQPQVALESLLRMSHTMQETPFQWCFIDKPRAGTSALIYHDPARRAWPADGIRYAQTQENTSRMTLRLPNHPNETIEVETSIITQGIFPPASLDVPLGRDTPELIMARYRIRWRIVTPGIGNPGLFLVYWGRDPNLSNRAPPGWERELYRRYPLPPVNETPQFPLRINPQIGPPPLQWQQAQNGAPPQMVPQRPPTQPQQQPMKRPLTGNQPQPQHMSPPHPQNQILQQPIPQQSQPPPNMQHLPPNMRPPTGPQQSTPQSKGQPLPSTPQGQPLPLAQQQQQQQQQAAAMRQMQHQQQQAAQLQYITTHLSFPLPFNDTFDLLTERNFAGLRYETNHALVAPIFDPLTCNELLTLWKPPNAVDRDDIQKQIEDMEAEIAKLSASVQEQKEKATITSPERRKANSTLPMQKTGSAMKDSQRGYEALLAPLPTMMSIAEMKEGAYSAAALRKQIADQEAAAIAAEREKERAEEEEERRKKEEAEAAVLRAEQEKADAEKKAQEAKEAEERAEQERLAQAEEAEQQKNEMALAEVQKPAEENQDAGPDAIMENDFLAVDLNTLDESVAEGLEEQQQMNPTFATNPGQDFMDDSYLYANNLGYDGNMEESLFELEYLNQMGDV